MRPAVRVWARGVALVLLAFIVLGARRAFAAGGKDDLMQQAEADDAAFAFERALAEYDAVGVREPSSPAAARADARAAVLRAHAEGAFVPFARLERVRRDPALGSSAAAIDELVHEADAFPPGLVRIETWELAAEAYASRFDRPADAERLYQRILADPQADDVTARKAARDLVRLLLARGDLTAAADAAKSVGERDAKLAADVRRAVRRRFVHLASMAALGSVFLLSARALVAAARRGAAANVWPALRRMLPIAVAYGAYVGIGGALLAMGYEAGTSRPFLFFAAVLVPLVLLARAWAAAGGSTRRARVGRAVLCASGVLGAAFLVLERVEVSYLEGMGL